MHLKKVTNYQKIDQSKRTIRTKENKLIIEGLPFTGLLHYDHILVRTIKDTVTRWAYQTGHHVERRFDCHGLPVEYEIDKTFDMKGSEDVAEIRISTYHNRCRHIVMRYTQEWENVIDRKRRSIDFQHDYKTMYPSLMESIWCIFEQLYDKDIERVVTIVHIVIGLGRVLRQHKVIPMKYPLPEFVIIHKGASMLKDVECFEYFILEVCYDHFRIFIFIIVFETLNVRKITLSQERELYGVEPNYLTFDKRASGRLKLITKIFRQMTDIDIEKLLLKFETDDITIDYSVGSQTSEIAYFVLEECEEIEAILRKSFKRITFPKMATWEPDDDAQRVTTILEKRMNWLPIIIIVVSIISLLIVGLVVFVLRKRRANKGYRQATTTARAIPIRA
ncbi:unnamed protein product [Rotaria sp. Silwood1]|nr:unnamed protein product [Rotaria sp. Silwood1]